MKVLLVNTSEKTGGAAIAAKRLMKALQAHGVEARMLVRDRQTEDEAVSALKPSPLLRGKFVWERATIWLHNHFSQRNLWQIDIANVGTDITRLPDFAWADVIHLHWVNQGFMSWRDVERILCSGKRVVWTLHDQWPYTGVCHYAEDCLRYQTHCHHCPLLVGGGNDEASLSGKGHDLAYRLFARKRRSYAQSPRLTFVGCSQWISDEARKSALLQGDTLAGMSSDARVVHIPNTIDQCIFHPMSQAEARAHHGLPLDKKLLLFSSLKVTDKRKGIDYLIEACRLLHAQYPEWDKEVGIVVVGKAVEETKGLFPYPLYPIDYISDEVAMARLYAAVDVFVTPSLQDNLPNTLVEAMSVGTPCVGFRVGGIPEMIHHQRDGYVAAPCDAQDLCQGIRYVLDGANHARLSAEAAQQAVLTYSPERVVPQYLRVYGAL